MTKPEELIEAYMATFASNLAVPPRRRGRVLEETDAHLRDITEGLVVAGATAMEAQRHAVARYGAPEAAAAQFGSSPTGLAYRFVLGLVHSRHQKRRAVARSTDRLLHEAGGDQQAGPQPSPSPACDVCGREVAADDMSVMDLSALGDLHSPVTLVVHPACHDIAAAVFALRGMPVTVAHPPAP